MDNSNQNESLEDKFINQKSTIFTNENNIGILNKIIQTS